MIDVETCGKETLREISIRGIAGLAVAAGLVAAGPLAAQADSRPSVPDSAETAVRADLMGGPPASTHGFFPLSEVKPGLEATAWTVFEGTRPEPMRVKILGVLHGGRGPRHDMILAQLEGAKPEYTGVVAGMSGSPVYVGDRLLGSLSYRIGQFSKDPIAGITPIEQMLEVRDLPAGDLPAGQADFATPAEAAAAAAPLGSETNLQAMETPLVMSGFRPEAVRLWQERMKGTGLDMVAAGGMGAAGSGQAGSDQAGSPLSDAPVKIAPGTIEPGSAVSAELVRGDLEIAATCTVTYVDPKQLLACGHPILQAGPVSLPMTETDVVATLASPLNSFKIVNTGAVIGAFTEDRDSAIKGVLGATARMIPVHAVIHEGAKTRTLNVEILDVPALTGQALLVSLYNTLLETNESTAETSYHITGTIAMDGSGGAPQIAPIDTWASGGDTQPAQIMAALEVAQEFNNFYTNGTRVGAVRRVDLDVEEIPRRVSVELESARIVSSNIVHAGDEVTIEATLRPYQQAGRNVRIAVRMPDRLQPGPVRLLVSDATTLDRTLEQPKLTPKQATLEAEVAAARAQHAADRIYVSLLAPETQADLNGRTLVSLPISMANALETLRDGQEATLHGETAVLAADAPAGGVLSGYQVLTVQIEPGGGVN